MKKKQHNHKLINDLETKIQKLERANFALSLIINNGFNKNPEQKPLNLVNYYTLEDLQKLYVKMNGEPRFFDNYIDHMKSNDGYKYWMDDETSWFINNTI